MASRSIQILIVAPPPADTFDMAGGTLAHHADQGDKITAVIATTGVRSHHWELAEKKRLEGANLDVEKFVEKAAAEKLEEVRNACRIMGYDDVRDLGFEDDDILVTQDKIEAIADAIRDVRPDILISHHPFESGGLKMHGTIGQATMYAWQVASGTGRGRQLRHSVPCIYFMNPMAYMGNNSLQYASTARADLYVDITDVIDKKVQALDYISSQFYGGPYARKRSETDDGAHGNKARVAYAEQFQRFYPLVRHTLPITDAELDHIDQHPEVGMARLSEMVGAFSPLPANMSFTSEHRTPKEKYND